MTFERMRRVTAYLPRVARVSVALSVLSALVMLLVARNVRARVNDLTVRFGDELSRLPSEQTLSGSVDGDAYRVLINGASARISSGVTTLAVAEVLENAFQDCSRTADGMEADFNDLRHAIQPHAARARTGAPGFSAVKQVEGNRGYVLCFANGHELSQTEAWQRLQDAVNSGDLTKIGQLRYVNARKEKDGSTFVYAVWTDAPFNVKTMFPETGDAPGSDPAGIARPAGSRRIFTSTVEGAPAAIRVYDVPLAPLDAMRFYSEVFPKAGYPAAVVTDAPEAGRIFATPQTTFMVQIAAAEPGRSTVSITESRFRTTARP